MALVAPNVCRYSTLGTYAGGNWASVIDLRPTIVSGPLPDRPEVCNAMGARLAFAWVAGFRQRMSDKAVIQRIDWVDLDSTEGSTGTVGAVGLPLPATGQSSSSGMPGNVACRVRKNAAGPRGSRPGSIYVVGLPEDQTDLANPRDMSPAGVSAWQTAANNFMSTLETPIEHDAGEYIARMVVVRTTTPPGDPSGEPEYRATSSVTSLSVQARIASQRRRQR